MRAESFDISTSLCTLGEVFTDIKAGVSVNCEDRPAMNGEAGVLKLSAVVEGHFFPKENKAVPNGEVERLGKHVKGGTFLVSRSNTSELVGAAAYVDEDWPTLFLPDLLWQATVSDCGTYHPPWVNYLLTTEPIRRIIKARASGTSGSMKKLSMGAFRSIHFECPPYDYQMWISKRIAAWDDVNIALDELIDSKRELKKGLMQQLLTGKRRYPEFVQSTEKQQRRYFDLPADWKFVRVGKVASEVLDRNGATNGLPVLSCTKHDGLVESLKYFGRQVFSDDLSNYKVVRNGQFAYATNHIEEGSIGLLDSVDAGIVSPMYTVFETSKDVYAPFLYLLFKTELYRHIFEANTNASVDRRGSLRWSQFKRLHIPLPAKAEQEKIAECISICRQEIDLLEQQRDILQEQKKGLMQQLLTGQTRLKLPKGGCDGT